MKQRNSSKSNQKPSKKPTRRSPSRSKLSLIGQTQVSMTQALKTQQRSGRLADQVIDNAQLTDAKLNPKPKAVNLFGQDQLKIIFLGGQDGIGSRNMIIIEDDSDALVVDCGLEFGLDLPGVNYAICDFSYLETIKSKLKGYVLTHGHLDHIGALPHILPHYPAPIYGSTFTIGMIKKNLGNFAESIDLVDKLQYHEMNIDRHERLLVGKSFYVELVRITHSIPQSTCVVVDTPLGRIINTGDFRLDPEPLDMLPSDIKRLKQLGDEGVLVLLSESTNAQKPGRTPTEHTLQASFDHLLKHSQGRIFVVSFSSNINRIQMVIEAAVANGRKIAIDGRSMIQHIELAIRLGLLKIPKDTIVTLAQLGSLADDQILMLCTGSQGEMGAALQRMSVGEHKYINLKAGDTVIVSSKPIPGNFIAYEKLGDDLVKLGCRLYRSPTWDVDEAVGELHVSGHGCRDEQHEMLELIRPKYFVPIYAGALNRKYHLQIAQQQAKLDPKRTFMLDNGDMLIIDSKQVARTQPQAVAHGSVLIDDSGQTIPSVVIKDRLLLTSNGLVVVILTIHRETGQLIASPDIVTWGFIHIRDNGELMDLFRNELKRAVDQRFNRIPLDRFKTEIKDHITHFLYNQTQRSPIVIPVVNVVSNGLNSKSRSTKFNSIHSKSVVHSQTTKPRQSLKSTKG